MRPFGIEAIRLLRERWGQNVQALAEELYAILQTSIPWNAGAGTVTNRGSGPSLTLNQGGDGPAISINPAPVVPPAFPGLPPLPANDFTPAARSGLPGAADLPPITIGYGPDGGLVLGGTSLTFLQENPDGTSTPFNLAGPNPADNPQPQQGGGGMPGKVVSGSGDTYQVKVYPQGLALPSQTVTCKQLQIADDESIDADTWVIVAKTTNGSHYMQAPVWMDEKEDDG